MGFQKHVYIILDDKLLTTSHTKKMAKYLQFLKVFIRRDPTRISIRLYLIACKLGRMLLTANYRMV